MSKLRLVNVYDVEAVSNESALFCADDSRAMQQFKEECDINTIIDRFGVGELPPTMHDWTTNVDIVDATSDFQTAMNELNAARDQFMSLPARIRSRFDNDPHLFVNFVSDSSNFDELVSLGLAVKRPDLPLKEAPAQSST